MSQISTPWKWRPWLRYHIWRAKHRRGIFTVPWDKFSEFTMSDAARRVVEEFYKLSLPAIGRGVEVAAASVDIDPERAWGTEDHILEWSALRGCSLFPLGEMDGGHEWLLIDERGRVFMSCIGGVGLIADRFEDALTRLVYGRQYEEDVALLNEIGARAVGKGGRVQE